MFPSKPHNCCTPCLPVSSSSAFICLCLTPLSPSSSSAHICCESEQRSTGSPEYYLKNFHSSSRLLVSPSICCPEPKGNMGFTKRARAAENAITGYPSRFPSFSLLIQGNAGMVRTCSPLRLVYFSSHSFSSPLFLLLLQFLIFHFSPSLVLFRVIAPSVATSASVFLCGLYFAPSCSEAILPLLSGAFFIAVYHPLFSLSDFLSRASEAHIDIHKFSRHIGSIRSDFTGLMEGSKQKSQQVKS